MIVQIVRMLASSKGLFAAAVVAGAISGLGLSFGGASHTVVAHFSNVNGLTGGNEVRIGGIEVGTVQSLDVNADPQTGQQAARVSFTVDNAHWPLRQGTTVAVRPKGVLSNVYVDVEPGSPDAPSLGDNPTVRRQPHQQPGEPRRALQHLRPQRAHLDPHPAPGGRHRLRRHRDQRPQPDHRQRSTR